MSESEKSETFRLLGELDVKIACETSLYEFAKAAWHIVEPGVEFSDNWHIKAICDHLEASVRGDIKKALFNIPPGCMKSLLTSVFLPAWVWGPANMPETRLMFVSYSASLSTRDSVKCRNIIKSSWYQKIWGDRFKFVGDQNAKTKYENDKGGWRIATSIGGAGTGEHPDLLILDDPHNVAEAESEVERESAIEWVDGTLSSRGVIRDVRLICAMQRLHFADMSGHFLEQGGWEHIKIPMEYEPENANPATSIGWVDPRTTAGELLWPEKFTREKVDDLTLSMGESRATGQLQQRPPETYEGNEFPASYFNADRIYYDQLPPVDEITLRIMALDPSKGKTKTADFSALIFLCLTKSGIMYVDAVLERWDYQQITDNIVNYAFDFKPDGVVIESNLYEGILSDMIGEKSKQLGFGLPIFQDRASINKVERIRRLTPYLARYDFRFKRNSPGVNLLLSQLKSFPSGKHDDGPDALEKAICLTRELFSRPF